jgi:hypothetical protein
VDAHQSGPFCEAVVPSTARRSCIPRLASNARCAKYRWYPTVTAKARTAKVAAARSTSFADPPRAKATTAAAWMATIQATLNSAPARPGEGERSGMRVGRGTGHTIADASQASEPTGS